MGGFLIIVILLCLAGIMYIKRKQMDRSVRKDAIEFDTQKSVSQITAIIRSLNCEIQHFNDPLGSRLVPAISVLLVGQPTITDNFRHPGGAASVWGVQVIVNDIGNNRHVRLVALGQSLWGNTRDNKGYGMGFSREYRDKIADMLA